MDVHFVRDRAPRRYRVDRVVLSALAVANMKAKMTKKIRRAISADESIRRYFHALEREMRESLSRRYRLARIEHVQKDNVHVVMQIQAVHETPEGVYIEVR